MINRPRCRLLAGALALSGLLSLLSACRTPVVPEPRAAVPTKAVARGDILWHFVHDQCVPNAQDGKSPPSPCIKVDLDKRYVIFKDKNGPLQYLHMPTDHVTGLEDPRVANAPSTAYFAQAWHNRVYMDRLLGKPIPLQDYSLTINSKTGRSQNHLHIHISCIRPALRDRLTAQHADFNSTWKPLSGGINGHAYQVRTVSQDELASPGAIALATRTLAGAKRHMDQLSLALYPLSEQQFLLFATQGMGASAEGDFQDHRCPQLLEMQ